MLSSLKNSSYRLYFFGTLAHFGAMSMQIVTSPLLIYRITESTAWLGIMSLVSAAPMIAISVFGGAFADRMQKKKILITGMLCFAVISFGIAMALSTGQISSEHTAASKWILLAASAIQGVIMGLMMPALQAIIPDIVSRDQLMNAIALNTMGMNALSLVASFAAGYVIESFGFKTVYFSMVLLYVLSAFFLASIPSKSKITASVSNIMSDIQQGFGYIRKDSLIILILAFTLIIVVLSMPYQQLMPKFTDDILKVGAKGLGTLMGVSGAGALIGSIILAVLSNRKRGYMLLGSGIVAGIALLIFSFSSCWALSLVVIFFVGLCQTFRMTIGSTLLQAYTQNVYMGRVMSILNMQWGFMSIFTFFAGILAEVVNVQWVLGGMAILLTVISLLFSAVFPDIRKVE
jgi:MFS family permease